MKEEGTPSSEKLLKGTRLVIIDWSGVISDDRNPVFETARRMIETFTGQNLTFEEWLAYTDSCSNAPDFFINFGVQMERGALQNLYSQEFSLVRGGGIKPVIYPDVTFFLQELKKKNLSPIVVSSHPEESLLIEADSFGITTFISGIIGGILDKGEVIEDTYSRLKIPNSETIYIGDSIHDIRAAKKAQVKSVGITTGYHSKNSLLKESPDMMVDSLTEVVPHL